MKSIYSFIFTYLFFLNFYYPATAQEINPCGTDELESIIYSKKPELYQVNKELLSGYLQTRENGNQDTLLIIPVVFHILHLNGAENISDAQVYDQMEILNRDFRKMNADTVDVIPEFQSLIADIKIEFRLATIDNNGNCTNGIEHIFTHETWIGDNYSKINQWPRNKYLNIWVVDYIASGAAGYAYLPVSADDEYFYLDGIVIEDKYVGSIGTSTPYRSRVLTHEVGHYLGLSHLWGSGAVESNCGDDGLDDTPVTKGWYGCPTGATDVCTPGIEENFQNYMDYSYCNRMFTPDQGSFMRYILQSGYSDRYNLITPSNLAATGADLTNPPLCPPMADFRTQGLPFLCSGESITFYDQSWRAPVDTYSWSFPTGTPSVSSLANPTVTFNSPGYHDVTLTVSNASGSDSKTVSQAVWVSYPWVDFIGPHNEDFESVTADDWLIYNYSGNNEKWELVNSFGNNHCYKLDYYSSNDPDTFYRERLGGRLDYLISPAFDLDNTTSVQVSFDYSGATMATTPDELTDYLRIYYSTDCGSGWALKGEILGADLVPGAWNNTDFVPVNSSQWGHYSFTLNNFSTTPNMRFIFEYSSSDFSNNFYIDNFNVNGILSNNEITSPEFSIDLFPNPVTAQQDLHIHYDKNEDVVITIHDIHGKIISNEKHTAQNSPDIVLRGSKLNLQPGVYLITLSDESGSCTKKLVVL